MGFALEKEGPPILCGFAALPLLTLPSRPFAVYSSRAKGEPHLRASAKRRLAFKNSTIGSSTDRTSKRTWRLRMPKSLRTAIVLLLVASAIGVGVGASEKTPAEPGAVREIRGVLDRQVQAWNRRDLEGFMQGYWHSPDLTFYSGGTVVSGWEQTLGRYRDRYQSAGNEMGHLEFLDLRIELLGSSAAFVRGRFHLKMTGAESSGLFTLTFRKFSGGWKIVHDHTSTA
jgi:ketosteroid isomerase-like protein